MCSVLKNLCLTICSIFLLAIVLSVLRFTASDYHFGIFKVFPFFSRFCYISAKQNIYINNPCIKAKTDNAYRSTYISIYKYINKYEM